MTGALAACEDARRALDQAARALDRVIAEAHAETQQPPAQEPVVVMLSAREAATRIGCGVTRLYKLMNAGEIKGVKVGRSRKFRVADLDAWVKRLPASPA